VRVVRDVWLSIPQAVFLIATGDLPRAREFPEDNPDFLVFLVARELASKPHFVPLGPSFTDEQLLDAWRTARQKLSDAAPDTEVYGLGLKALRQVLADGLARGKGIRNLDGPFELIDPVEFSQVDLWKLDARNVIFKRTTWYSIRVSACDLLELRRRARSGDIPPVGEAPSVDFKPNRPRRSGGWQHPRWLGARDAATKWLVDNGCPVSGDGGQAELERHVASWLEEHGYEARESSVRRYVSDWIKERREELGIPEKVH
jgi:hypothetical protein